MNKTMLRRLMFTPLLVAALVAAVLVAGAFTRPHRPGRLLLGSGTSLIVTTPCNSPGFCISGNVAGLYPGIHGSLLLTVSNPNPVPIIVGTLSALAADANASCLAADVNATSFAGSLLVGAGTPSSPGTATQSLNITLINSTPSVCQGKTWVLTYGGTASSTVTLPATTALGSSLSPSNYGQSVTFTDTVTPPSGDPTPTGTIAFKDNGTTLATVPMSGGQAHYTTAALAVGSHPMTAVYTSDTYYATSTGSVTQVVNSATGSVLGSSLSPSNYGQSVTFTDTVTAGSGSATGTVTFYDGATSIGTGTLSSTGPNTSKATLTTSALTVATHPISAAYPGAGFFLPTTSNPVNQVVGYSSTISGSQNGGLTVGAGQAVNVTSAGKVNGTVTVNSGGTLFLNGGTVNGGVTVNSGGGLFVNGGTINGGVTTTGATALTLCGATNINGNVSASGSGGFVLIGDAGDDGSPACATNKITGNVTLTSNTHGVELGGNTITGNVTLTSNSGGPAGENAKPEVEANHITGTLGCTGNTFVINDGKPNTVSGSRTGQCAGF
jgi:hypothetical protein